MNSPSESKKLRSSAVAASRSGQSKVIVSSSEDTTDFSTVAPINGISGATPAMTTVSSPAATQPVTQSVQPSSTNSAAAAPSGQQSDPSVQSSVVRGQSINPTKQIQTKASTVDVTLSNLTGLLDR